MSAAFSPREGGWEERRKGREGKEGKGEGGGGGTIKMSSPLDFPQVLVGTCHSAYPQLTFLWPVSLGGQVLFEIGKEKKKDEVVCPTEQSCFHTVSSVAGCESGGERRYC